MSEPIELLSWIPSEFAALPRDISGVPVYMDEEKLKAAIWPLPTGRMRVWIEALPAETSVDDREAPLGGLRESGPYTGVSG